MSSINSPNNSEDSSTEAEAVEADGPVQASCASCGAQVGKAKFCPECGTPVKLAQPTCSSCGHEPEASTKFCPECGAKMTS